MSYGIDTNTAAAQAWQERWHREFAHRWVEREARGGAIKLFPRRLKPELPCRAVIAAMEREIAANGLR